MCVAAATVGLIAGGVSAGLGVMQFFQANAQARAAERQADQSAKMKTQQGIQEQERAIREERRRQGEEVVQIGRSGVSGSFGSPFLVALENAQNFGVNLANYAQSNSLEANAIRAGGRNQASQIRMQGFNSLAGAVTTGYGTLRDYRRTRQNAVFLGGNTLPGVV